MKNLFAALLMLWLCSACQSDSPTTPISPPTNKQIEVAFYPNIHFSHVIELFVWPGDYPTRPLVMEAQQYFGPYKYHPAVQFSDSLLQNEIFYFDELTEILLYYEDFPSMTKRYPLSNSPYAGKEKVIEQWIRLLRDFYVETKAEAFFKANEAFYQGAKQEVIRNLPPMDFVQQIESYYRADKIKYTIIPAPEMPTGGAYGQRGIGPYIYAPNGMLIYQVISASLPIEADSASGLFQAFGFNNKEFTLRNSYHEFGHAFVNPVLEKNQSLVDQYQGLFVEELKEVMSKQNYNNWFDCIAEHLVRLGEIRLAARSGNSKWAEELRDKHIDELDFIFLPEMEQKILAYEQDPSIKSFEEFLPDLLGVLEGFNKELILARLAKQK